MSRITVIGAGPLGRATTASLLARGDDVTVATRSGTSIDGAKSVIADVTNSTEFVAALPASDAIVACCNFPYGQWQRNWPPAIRNLIAAAERHEAPLVIAGNLYAYGPSSTPVKESDPFCADYRNGRIRAEVWRQALDAHEAGRIRVTEVRGSDYIGPTTGPNAHGGDRLLGPVLEGKTAQILGSADQPHAWTAVADFGAMLAQATIDSRMLGRAWHVPSAPALTIRELATLALHLAGIEAEPRIQQLPRPLMRALGLFSGSIAGLCDAAYQFDAPFLLDDTDARTLLGAGHTPIEETIGAAVRSLQSCVPAAR